MHVFLAYEGKDIISNNFFGYENFFKYRIRCRMVDKIKESEFGLLVSKNEGASSCFDTILILCSLNKIFYFYF